MRAPLHRRGRMRAWGTRGVIINLCFPDCLISKRVLSYELISYDGNSVIHCVREFTMGKRYLFAIRHLWQDVLVDDGELQTYMDNVTSGRWLLQL